MRKTVNGITLEIPDGEIVYDDNIQRHIQVYEREVYIGLIECDTLKTLSKIRKFLEGINEQKE